MNWLSELFSKKKEPLPEPAARYKVTFNFVDRGTGRVKTVTVPNATAWDVYNEETCTKYSHRIFVGRDIQAWIESDSQSLISVTSEVVRG